jgi:hypothetical protein
VIYSCKIFLYEDVVRIGEIRMIGFNAVPDDPDEEPSDDEGEKRYDIKRLIVLGLGIALIFGVIIFFIMRENRLDRIGNEIKRYKEK